MATVRLGDVSGITALVTVPATLVGSQPIWSDDSDASYVEYGSRADRQSQAAGGTVPSVGGNSGVIRVRAEGIDPLNRLDTIGVSLWEPTITTRADFGVSFTQTMLFGTTWFESDAIALTDADKTLLASGTSVAAVALSGLNIDYPASARVYEVELIFSGRATPLRRFPSRHFVPRTVNRRAGGTY